MSRLPENLHRFLAFALVSGMGVVLDFSVYTAFCASGTRAGIAYVIGAACGVTFVFVVASRKIFQSPSGWLVRPFVAYALYQVVAISIGGLAVDGLDVLYGGLYLLAKVSVLPVTLTVNYLVTQRILSPSTLIAPPAAETHAAAHPAPRVEPTREPVPVA